MASRSGANVTLLFRIDCLLKSTEFYLYETCLIKSLPMSSTIFSANTGPSDKSAKESPVKLSLDETKGTAFVIYEDIFDAKNAVDHLSGFNVAGRYSHNLDT